MLTPCIKICKLDPITRWCIGCARTVDEITQWKQLTDLQRKDIMQQLPSRRNT